MRNILGNISTIKNFMGNAGKMVKVNFIKSQS